MDRVITFGLELFVPAVTVLLVWPEFPHHGLTRRNECSHPTGPVESRLLGDGHGRFGGRARETNRVEARERALTRSYCESLAFRLRPGNAGSNTATGAGSFQDHASLRILKGR